jgi:hypothetical protein
MDISLNEDQVKRMATRLRDAIGRETLSQSKALETLALTLGHPNWDTLVGLLRLEARTNTFLEKPVNLYLEVGSSDEFGESPIWARIELSDAWLTQLQQLASLCHQRNLYSTSVSSGCDEWEREEYFRMNVQELFVDKEWFWIQAYPKHSNHSVSTLPITIEHLLHAVATRTNCGPLVWCSAGLVANEALRETLQDEGVIAD